MKVRLSNDKEFGIETYENYTMEPKVKLVLQNITYEEIKENFKTENLSNVKIINDNDETVCEYFNYELCESITPDYIKFIVYIQEQNLSDLISTLNDQVSEANTVITKMNETVELVDSLISITTEKSDKTGYLWKITKIGDVEVLKEYIEDPDGSTDDHDGSDYTKPAYYTVGDTVAKGLWYCVVSDPALVYECIKDGVPTSFTDTEYFDVV